MKKLKSVILIDDNEIDNFINQKIFEHCCETNILVFTSTSDALNYLKLTTNAPKLILLDMYLPIMDGFEFLDEFEKLDIAKQPIDIFILTASINPSDIERVRQKKCSGYIEKPLTTKEVLKLLEQYDNVETSFKLQVN